MREAKKGEKNPCWKGGISFEPYSSAFTKELKEAIRQRDNYTCAVCGHYPAFEVHHIDYDKKNCEPENLITLCKSCHTKTNFNRKYWINYFTRR
jgi:5-methylcytosine-specific restriction endonuclease McrA